MVPRLPPLSTLRTFEAAARLLSFTKAAEELHVTPAAVSQQIKNLETYLGVALFLRRPNVLQLTMEGLAMFPKIHDGLECFFAGVEATRLRKGLLLNVTAPPSFATRWLIPRLSRFTLANPEVSIRISGNPNNIDGPETTETMPNEVIDPRSNECEVAIRFGTGRYHGYRVERLMTPDYVVVCSPILLSGDSPIRVPSDLIRQTLIHDESIPTVQFMPSWHEWLKVAGVKGIDTERGLRFSNSIMAIEAAVEGQGVVLAHKPQVDLDVAAGRLVIPFAISMPSFYSYFLVVPIGAQDSTVEMAFQKWLQSEIDL